MIRLLVFAVDRLANAKLAAKRSANAARLRRQSLPRRYVNVSGVSVTIEWGTP